MKRQWWWAVLVWSVVPLGLFLWVHHRAWGVQEFIVPPHPHMVVWQDAGYSQQLGGFYLFSKFEDGTAWFQISPKPDINYLAGMRIIQWRWK